MIDVPTARLKAAVVAHHLRLMRVPATDALGMPDRPVVVASAAVVVEQLKGGDIELPRVLVALDGCTYVFAAGEAARDSAGSGAGTGRIGAPMPGKVIAVLVAVGERVEHGQPVVVIEAMKMETTLTADVDGEVARIGAVIGETVDAGALLVEISPA